MIARGEFPRPAPGLVIRYAYLWHTEALAGIEEGAKERPCAIVLTTRNEQEKDIVRVLPVTHRRPDDLSLAMEIPLDTKHRLGLDDDQSWIILSETNQFTWPGPDLRPARPGEIESIVYGKLPGTFYDRLASRLIATLRQKKLRIVNRSE